jgi:hypothetical protein
MRFFYSIWIAFLLGLALLAGAKEETAMAVTIGVFAAILLIWLIWRDLWELHNDELDNRSLLYQSRTKFILAMTGTTAEHRKFLAVEWPELGVEFGGEHIVYLLDNGANTGILMEFFRRFLEDSSDYEFVDLRQYNDDKFLQERFDCSRDWVRDQWHRATTHLRKAGYLRPGSMAGSHTYQWTTKGHYRRLTRQYAVMPDLPNVDTAEAQA